MRFHLGLTVAVIGLAVAYLLVRGGRPGLAQIELSVVEQRYRAVRPVEARATVTEVADVFGVSRQTLHKWLNRYRESGLAGLADRPRRPESCPQQVSPEAEAAELNGKVERLNGSVARCWGVVRRESRPGSVIAFGTAIRHSTCGYA